MVDLNARFDSIDWSDDQINESLDQLLRENTLGALATINNDKAHINTAYFVYDEHLNLYFLSQPSETHSFNVTKNPSVAVAIWATPREWGEGLYGVQLFGTCQCLGPGRELLSGMLLFLKRFPAFKSIIKHPGEFSDGITSRMYAVHVNSLKLLDEPRFGRRKYLSLNIII